MWVKLFCGHIDESEHLWLFFIKSYVWYINLWLLGLSSTVASCSNESLRLIKNPKANIIPASDWRVIDNDGAQANIVAAGGEWKRQQDGERGKKMKRDLEFSNENIHFQIIYQSVLFNLCLPHAWHRSIELPLQIVTLAVHPCSPTIQLELWKKCKFLAQVSRPYWKTASGCPLFLYFCFSVAVSLVFLSFLSTHLTDVWVLSASADVKYCVNPTHYIFNNLSFFALTVCMKNMSGHPVTLSL